MLDKKDTDDVVNITRIIDDAPISRLTVRVGLLCAAVALLDGSDTTSIGVAAPLIVHDLHLSRAYLGPIFSAATAGMMVGALGFGPLADRFGRKRALVLAMLVFGVFTPATALAGALPALLLARFLAGIGLGGAVPCFISLASEYAPRSRRAMVITLIWSAFPLGVILGAVLNAYLLAQQNWRLIFFIGGALPLTLCLIVMILLPESLRFLLLRKPQAVQTRRLVSKIVPGLPHGTHIALEEEAEAARTPVGRLFTGGRTVETLLVWVAYLAAFGMTAVTFYWSPILMHDHGVSLRSASLIVGVGGGLGSLLGAAGAGRMMERFGAGVVLSLTLLLATLGTAALGFVAGSPLWLSAVIIANVTLIAGISVSGMLALGASIYPIAMRSTGIGWAMGIGRLGEVVLPLLVGLLLNRTGSLGEGVFVAIAAVPLLGAVSAFALGRHSLALRAP